MVMSMAVHTTAEKMGTTQYESPSILTGCAQAMSLGFEVVTVMFLKGCYMRLRQKAARFGRMARDQMLEWQD